MKLSNIILPSTSPSGPSPPPTYTVTINNHNITSIRPSSPPLPPPKSISISTSTSTSAPSSQPPTLLLPPLCHPHIHLDKPYLLTSHACHPTSTTTTSNPIPNYSDLTPRTGSFSEALQFTALAKSRFTPTDLYLRGRQLLATAYTQGVTAARCFVEVDHVVGLMGVEGGLVLKREFEKGVEDGDGDGDGNADRDGGGDGDSDGKGKGTGRVDGSEAHTDQKPPVKLIRIQLCAFAQDPVFSIPHGPQNRALMEEALVKHVTLDDDGQSSPDGIEVLGSTPYVEASPEAARRNIDWAIATALKYELHLDFHLDYNLDEEKDPRELLVWYVLERLVACRWPTLAAAAPAAADTGDGDASATATTTTSNAAKEQHRPLRTVMLGHCTALTLLSPTDLTRLSQLIHTHSLPVSFVGLPTSDLYMMGRPPSPVSPPSTAEEATTTKPLHRPRGTLNPLHLSQRYDLSVALGVNNVGNAFTPFGNGDPLQLASWGVGIYQAGTESDAWDLYGALSWVARRGCGLEEGWGAGGGREPEKRGLGGGEAGRAGDGRGSGEGGEEVKEGWDINEGQYIGEFGVLMVRNEEYVGCPGRLGLRVPARQRWGIRDVVWDVPEVELRRVVR